jgi:hypothetical protein
LAGNREEKNISKIGEPKKEENRAILAFCTNQELSKTASVNTLEPRKTIFDYWTNNSRKIVHFDQ